MAGNAGAVAPELDPEEQERIQTGRPYEVWPVERIRRFEQNARKHPPEQIAALKRSLEVFGWTRPLFVDPEGVLRVGHGVLEAAEALGKRFAPVVILEGMTEEELRAYVIADNQLALRADWNRDVLASELAALDEGEFPMEALGFTDEELAELLAEEPEEGPGEGDGDGAGDEAPVVPVSALGDVWILGSHRLLCGDSTDPAGLEALIDGATVALVHADPPYGMGKEADGVENDNLYREKLVAFQLAWWRACRPHLAPNASVYVWGNAEELWRLWYRGLADSEPLTLRNEIVWDKQSIPGMASPDLTCYPTASERCLFFQLGRFVLQINQTKADYWPGWEPIRTYLAGERDRMGWKPRDIRAIAGNHMHGHWFGQSQWVFISPDNYAKLQAAAAGRAFLRPYEELRAEYLDLQRQFNGEVRDDRPYFDNAHDVMRDVWDFPRVIGEERHGHATPKPVAMMERVMRSSARAGEVVFEPFAGSGSTIMGAEAAGRRCFAVELQPGFVDVCVRRWEKATGQRARLGDATGPTFAEVAAERGIALGEE